jgi:hypothetical protein
VFAAVRHNDTFSFVLAGAEGSMHDSTLCRLAYDKGFKIASERFVLGDLGFGGHSSVIIPYNTVMYHLPEWEKSGRVPETREEHYNYRHSSLRSVVERVFGQVKKRWGIIWASAPEYTMKSQVRIVYAVTALHNFIKYMEILGEDDMDRQVWTTEEEAEIKERIRKNVQGTSGEIRERIADGIWEDVE